VEENWLRYFLRDPTHLLANSVGDVGQAVVELIGSGGWYPVIQVLLAEIFRVQIFTEAGFIFEFELGGAVRKFCGEKTPGKRSISSPHL
jgi:hypothetical protein